MDGEGQGNIGKGRQHPAVGDADVVGVGLPHQQAEPRLALAPVDEIGAGQGQEPGREIGRDEAGGDV